MFKGKNIGGYNITLGFEKLDEDFLITHTIKLDGSAMDQKSGDAAGGNVMWGDVIVEKQWVGGILDGWR